MLTTLVFITLDLVLGVMAARKRGEKITSLGFRRTIVKLSIYEVAIMLGFLCETYMTGDLVPISKIIAGFIGITEMKSLMENLNEVSGTDLLKDIISRLASPRSKE